jgi:O-antigen/teichoic acid export membrane protein
VSAVRAPDHAVRGTRLSTRALWGLASWALPLALIFFITPSLVRELGAQRFGILMMLMVAPVLASQFDFGLAASGVRRFASILSTGQVDAGRTLATLAVAMGTVGVALGAAVWLASGALGRWLGLEGELGHGASSSLVRHCAAWIGVALLTQVPFVLARAAQAMAWIAAVQTASTAVLWLTALVVARSGHPLTEIVLTGIVTSIVAALATAVAMRRHVRWTGSLGIDLGMLRSDARFSSGMFSLQIAGAIVYQGDRILISAVGSPAIAGAYALCTNVANKTLAGISALTSFAFPHASGLAAGDDKRQVAAFLHAVDRGVVVLLAPTLLPGVLLADDFLGLWLKQYATAELVTVFRILWIAFAVSAFSIPVGTVLAACGNTRLASRFAWLTVAVVVMSIPLLVPAWGATGAAIGMFLGAATSPVFNVVARQKLALPAPTGRGQFWTGVALGCATQAFVLAFWHGRVENWPRFVLAGATSVAAFYIARAIFGRLSPEEARVFHALRILRKQPP